MYNSLSFVALHHVLLMVALSADKAEGQIICNGVKHLPAGRYTISNCTECTIVGEPGTILKGPILCSGALNLNGSVALEGNGQPQCLHAPSVAFNGNVEVKNCQNINAGYGEGVVINGGEAGQYFVSIQNSSTTSDVSISVRSNARVTIQDSSLSPMENFLHVKDSYVSFERVDIYSEYEGYNFTNSTIVASNTSFGGGHPDFFALDSVLNFTNSSVSFIMGNWYPGISLSRCTVDVTCDAPTAVFSTGSSNAGSMGMNIIDSNMHFERCSCHLDRAISVAGPLSIRNASVTFGSCQEFGTSKEVHESVPVLV